MESELYEAMKSRHSVRRYKDIPLDKGTEEILRAEISACNSESGLHIQLVTDEPKAFDCFMAHYGKFSGVRNYIALVGKKDSDLDKKCGFYGERIVLTAQKAGLNTCWVAMSYKKIPKAFEIGKGEKLAAVIAVGTGANRGVPHRSKDAAAVSNINESSPEWFKAGVEAALLAPTAVNQQKFRFTQKENTVSAKAGIGFYTKMDLGIAKYHFELAAGKENFRWE